MQAIHQVCSIPLQISPFSSFNFSTFSLLNSHQHQHQHQHQLFLRPNTPFPYRKRHRFGVIAAATRKVDYYTTLNVDRNASLDQIKSSYRKLARKYHPDISKISGSEEKFKEVSAAYEVLSNEEKRGLYDRFGEAGLQAEFNGPSFAEEEVDPFQVFGSLFGDTNGFFGGEGIGESRHLDIWSDISLTFEESIFGGKQEIEIPCLETCEACGGTGAKSSRCIKSCTVCGGRGSVMRSQNTPFGRVSQVSSCQSCQGDGRIVTDKCVKCGGSGNIRSKRTLDLVIPPGVVDGATMQLRGEGNTDVNRKISGDLYLVLHVKEKHGIWRDGLNLVSRVSITYTEAILGTVIKVETVEGAKELQIPSGIQPGDTLKLSYLGVPKGRESGRGDHVFIVDVQIPKTISDREKELLEELASLRTSDKSKVTTNRIYHSYQKGKTGNSVWNSVQRLFRGRQSRSGFASATTDMPPILWMHGRMDSSFSTSWTVLFLFTCIFALVTNITLKSLLGNEICNDRAHNLRRTKNRHIM